MSVQTEKKSNVKYAKMKMPEKIKLYSNENFPLPVVTELRQLGYDVLTIQETGKAELAVPDEEVLAFAILKERPY